MSKMARSVASEVGVDIFSVNLYVRKCGAEEMAHYGHEETAPFIEDDKVRDLLSRQYAYFFLR